MAKTKKEPVFEGRDELLTNPLKLFAIRNSSGQFYRSKGWSYSGTSRYNSCWVDDINKAKIYTRAGGARGIVTYFGKAYPQYPAPELVIIETNKVLVVDESARIAKALEKEALRKEREQLDRAEAIKAEARRQLIVAQKKLMDAELALEKERSKLEEKKDLR